MLRLSSSCLCVLSRSVRSLSALVFEPLLSSSSCFCSPQISLSVESYRWLSLLGRPSGYPVPLFFKVCDRLLELRIRTLAEFILPSLLLIRHRSQLALELCSFLSSGSPPALSPLTPRLSHIRPRVKSLGRFFNVCDHWKASIRTLTRKLAESLV